MGLKSFFKKVGNGFKKAGRWIRDKALPAVGRIAKPVFSLIGALPGHIGMVGKIGSGIANVLHDGISKIPNTNIKDKLNRMVGTATEGLQRVVGNANDIANKINNGIGVVRDVGNTIKQGINTQIKPVLRPI